ncbi:hypothetical protein K502DRAFT_348848 [Neoconidiobolus thromboides FSU 785]|nr:hypothetical protein K502DRAFT_348848 [Neoconidiobolus thromboides FSU 785]
MLIEKPQTPVQRRKNQAFQENVLKKGSVPTTLKKKKDPEEIAKINEQRKRYLVYVVLAIFLISGFLSFLQLFF